MMRHLLAKEGKGREVGVCRDFERREKLLSMKFSMALRLLEDPVATSRGCSGWVER